MKNEKIINIPGSVKVIPFYAFCESEAEEAILEAGIEGIEMKAFAFCENLKTITVPDSVHEIHINAFLGTSIETVNASDFWKESHPDLLRLMIPDEVEDNNFLLEGTTLVRYLGRQNTVKVPDGVEHIEEDAFRGNDNILKVVLPDGLLSIGPSAFQDCRNLKAINLPSSLCKLGGGAFLDTRALEGISIPGTVKRIPRYAFMGSGIKNVQLGVGVQEILCEAFAYSDIREITVPDSVTTIESRAFADCRVDYLFASEEWKSNHWEFVKRVYGSIY